MTRWLIAVMGTVVLAGTACAHARLVDLVQAGNDAAALKMIVAGANVNMRQGDGTTALDWATYRLDVPLVKALLEHGANPNLMNNLGSCPLDQAVKAASYPLVKMLLKAGAHANEANSDGETPMMLAAHTGVVKIAKLLFHYGAKVNGREHWRGQTALMWAAGQKHAEMVRFLLSHGAKINIRAHYNDWLGKATQITSEPRAQYRAEGGLTALLYAARSGCLGCVKALLKAGANVNWPTPNGFTPVITAIDNFHFDVAKYLLQHGANPNIWDWYGRTPLYVAVDMDTYITHHDPSHTRPKTTGLDLVRLILDMGANPNAQLDLHRPGRGGNSNRFTDPLLRTGCTPLLLASITHDTGAVKLLLEHGALVNLPNVMGVTPFMAAAGMGPAFGGFFGGRGDFSPPPIAQANAIRTLKLLLKAGAKINVRVTDTTSLTARIARGNTMANRQGQTALYGAISHDWPRVVAFLIRHGAKVNVVDDMGHTPLMAAERGYGGFPIRGRFKPNKQIIALLTKAGAVAQVASAGLPRPASKHEIAKPATLTQRTILATVP